MAFLGFRCHLLSRCCHLALPLAGARKRQRELVADAHLDSLTRPVLPPLEPSFFSSYSSSMTRS